jgi:8-oxo-dGTP diphosphatase
LEDHAGLAQAFPTVYWPAWDADATFLPEPSLPDAEAVLYAALVFAFFGDHVVLADIAGRGLCIPSGRIEPGEVPEQAAGREVWEETGGRFSSLSRLGTYRMVSRSESSSNPVRCSPVYVASLERFEALPSESESRGVILAKLADVPRLYFTWDPLIAAVFAYADASRTTQ